MSFIKANVLPLAIGVALGYLVLPRVMSAVTNR